MDEPQLKKIPTKRRNEMQDKYWNTTRSSIEEHSRLSIPSPSINRPTNVMLELTSKEATEEESVWPWKTLEDIVGYDQVRMDTMVIIYDGFGGIWP